MPVALDRGSDPYPVFQQAQIRSELCGRNLTSRIRIRFYFDVGFNYGLIAGLDPVSDFISFFFSEVVSGLFFNPEPKL